MTLGTAMITCWIVWRGLDLIAFACFGPSQLFNLSVIGDNAIEDGAVLGAVWWLVRETKDV